MGEDSEQTAFWVRLIVGGSATLAGSFVLAFGMWIVSSIDDIRDEMNQLPPDHVDIRLDKIDSELLNLRRDIQALRDKIPQG